MPAPHALAAMAERVLALLADGHPRSTGELADALGVNVFAVRRALQRLALANRVVRVGYRDDAGRAREWEAGKPVRYGVWTLRGMGPPEA